jgi:UDP-glucose 4-epimerase
MNILITGACGFIGSHLVSALQDHKLYLVDDLSTGKKENINDYNYEKLYINDYSDTTFLDEIFNYNIDVIVHLAAIASVQKCKDFPVESSIINSTNVLKLIDLARKNGVKKFLFASSAAVYGDEPTLPKSETSIITPISIYGIDKFAAEQYVLNLSDHGFNGLAFRFFNVFGPNQDPNSPYSGVLSIFTDRIIKKNEDSLVIFGDGEQTRDFISVFDVVGFIKYCIEHEVHTNVFNVSTGNSISLNQIVKLMSESLEINIDVNYQNTREGDIKYSSSINTKMLSTGYQLKYTFEEAFKDYLKSIK